jgi:hypothetical protein
MIFEIIPVLDNVSYFLIYFNSNDTHKVGMSWMAGKNNDLLFLWIFFKFKKVAALG